MTEKSNLENDLPGIVTMPLRQKPKTKRRYVGMDAPFFMIVCTLLFFGLVMVYSASYSLALRDGGSTTFYIRKQILCAVIGFAVMIGVAFIDYHFWKKLWKWIFAASIAALVIVLLIGTVRNNSKRWILIGPLQFQPSELTKIGLIVSFAAYIELMREKMKTFVWGVLPFMGTMGVVALLLYLEPHMSALILIGMTCIVMMFVGGVKKTHLAFLFALGATGLALLVKFTDFLNYIQRRFDAWRDPFAVYRDGGYQTVQSLYAVGSGGWFGLGLGNGRQKQLFLPESHNDYVFAIGCEELGYVGAMLLILLFAAFLLRGFWIAIHARDTFGMMLGVGIMTMMSLQIILNIAVVTNAIPVTGMSLPFFSYGGTALIVLLGEMGLMLSVSRQIIPRKEG